MDDSTVLKRILLQKLTRADIWGGKHTPLDLLKKNIPDEYRNTHAGRRAWERALRDVANRGWIVVHMKRTGKGSDVHISLNPKMKAEIFEFLKSILDASPS